MTNELSGLLKYKENFDKFIKEFDSNFLNMYFK